MKISRRHFFKGASFLGFGATGLTAILASPGCSTPRRERPMVPLSTIPLQRQGTLSPDSTTHAASLARSVAVPNVMLATWNGARAGDCQLDDATLTLRSDGTGHWSAVVFTYSTHSGDYWRASWEILDTQGVKVAAVPALIGPRMDDGNGGPPPKYHWEADFNYDATQFNNFGSVTLWSAC